MCVAAVDHGAACGVLAASRIVFTHSVHNQWCLVKSGEVDACECWNKTLAALLDRYELDGGASPLWTCGVERRFLVIVSCNITHREILRVLDIVCVEWVWFN